MADDQFEGLLTEEQLDSFCVLRRVWRTGAKIDYSVASLINVDCLKGIRRAKESGPVVALLVTLMSERGAVPRPLFPRILHVLTTYLPGAIHLSAIPPLYHEKHDYLVDMFLDMFEKGEYPEDIMSIITRALACVPDEKVQVKFKMLGEAKKQKPKEGPGEFSIAKTRKAYLTTPSISESNESDLKGNDDKIFEDAHPWI